MKYIRGDKIFYHRELADWLDGDTVNPITMELHLTNRCNMKCGYCFFSDRDKSLEMSGEEAFKCIDVLKSAGVKGLIFSGGGEPTIHKDFKEIIYHARNREIDIGLITNGIMDISDILSNFTWVRFSLDSCNPDTYSKIKGTDKFQQVTENIVKCIEKKTGVTIGVQMVITEDNYMEIFDMYDYVKKIEADYFQFRPLENGEYKNAVWSQVNNARDYFNQNDLSVITTENKWLEITSPDKHYEDCPGANFIGAVDPGGNFYICCHHVGKQGRYGNILTEDINDALANRAKVQKEFDYSKCPTACRGSNLNLALDNFNKIKHINFL